MPRPLVVVLLCLAASNAAGQVEEPGMEPMRLEGSARWGTISSVQEPHYPPSLRDGKGSVYLDISGRVLWSGELAEVQYVPGSDDAGLMIAPMRVVLDRWRFSPPLDRRCQPSGVPIRTRVSFDFSTDPPTLSTRTPDEARPSRTVKALTRVEPSFPREMQLLGFQSHVYAERR
jgi:hypothetical protein